MAGNRIYIQVDFQSQSANSAINTLNQNIKSIGTSSQQASQVAANGMNRFTLSIIQSSRALEQFSAAFAGIGFTKLADDLLRAGDAITRTRLALGDMFQSASQAAAVMAQLEDISQHGLFDRDSILAAGAALARLGVAAGDIPREVKIIADSIAAAGGSAEDFVRVTTQLGTIQASNLVSYRQLLSIMQAGVPVIQTIQKLSKDQKGVTLSVKDIRDTQDYGELQGFAFVQGLLKGMERGAQGKGADIGQQLYTNQVDKVKDAWKGLGDTVKNDALPAVSTGADIISGLIQDFNDLPKPIRQTTEATLALAAAIGAVGLAVRGVMALLAPWKALLMPLIGVLKDLGAAISLAFEAGSISTFFSLALQGFTGLTTLIGGATIALSAFVGYGVGRLLRDMFTQTSQEVQDWLTEFITRHPWLVKTGQFFDMSIGGVPVEQLAAQGGHAPGAPRVGGSQYGPQLPGRPLPARDVAGAPQGTPGYGSVFGEQQAAFAASAQQIGEAIKASEAELARAREKELGGIAAITAKWAEYYEKGKVSSKALANYHLAIWTEVQHELEELRKKDYEAQLDELEKRLQAEAEMVKAATARQAQFAAVAIADTADKRAALEAKQIALEVEGAEKVRQIHEQDAQVAYQKALIPIQELQRQLNAAKATGLLKPDQAIQQQILINNEIKRAFEDLQRAREKAADDTTDSIAKYELDVMQRTAQEASQYLEQARETSRQEAIDAVGRRAEIAKAGIDTSQDQSLQQRVAGIYQERDIAIQALQEVAALRQKNLQEDSDRQVQAYRNQIALFDDMAAKYKDVNDEIYNYAVAGAQNARDAIDALTEKGAQDAAAIAKKSIDDQTLAYIEAYKKANDTVAEDQRKVFDDLKSAFGRIFDALFQKASNVWSAIGNALKTAVLGAFKDIVTTRLAGQMMSLFTGQPVTFESRGGFGSGPFAQSGIGRLAAALSAKPVFGSGPQQMSDFVQESKILSHADVTNGAVHTTWDQQGPPPQIKVDSHQRIDIVGSGLGGGPTAPYIAGAALAAATSVGGGGYSGGGGRPSASTTTTFPDISDAVYTTDGGYGGGGITPFTGGPLLSGLLPGIGFGGSAPSSSFSSAGLSGGSAYGGGGYGGGGGLLNLLGLAPMLSANAPGTLPGAAPGAPPGGFGIPSLLGQIQKAGGIGSFFRQAQQYYTVGGGVTYGAVGPDGLPLVFGNPITTLPAQNLFNPAASAIAPLTLMGSVLGMQGAFSLGRAGQNGRIPAPLAGVGAGALGAFSGLLAAGSLAALFPSVFAPLIAAGPFGWIAAAGIGAAIGLTGLFKQDDQQHVRQLIRQMYGVDISNMNILNQIVSLAKQQFGGNYSLAVASPQVQQIVQLYAAETGIMAANMPRPMYPATFAQSSTALGGAAAGLQLQPTYMNGQLVASPYTGYTTQQMATAASLFYGGSANQNARNALYVQLDPAAAQSLFSGNVVNVLNSNPTVVGNVNSAAIAAGASRSAQLGGLLEPSTVLA